MMQAVRTWFWLPVVTALLSLGGCGRTPTESVDRRPEWSGAAVDGIAPLMSPPQVAAALARGGYVQVRCASQDRLLARPLYDKDGRACFQSPTRPMTISLYFLDLNEGRRLAVVNFTRFDREGVTGAERVRHGSAIARRLRARLGEPSAAVNQPPDYRSFYWNRPGGQPNQPDTISTTVGPQFPPSITMNSMWAYSQVRPEPR
jgi:hypothetical protein